MPLYRSTPYTKLVQRSEEVIVRLREALTSESNVDPARSTQLKEFKDIEETVCQAELTAINRIAYERIIEHLAWTLEP